MAGKKGYLGTLWRLVLLAPLMTWQLTYPAQLWNDPIPPEPPREVPHPQGPDH